MPVVTPLERREVERALDSGWLAPAGPTIAEFEDLVAQTCGSEYAVAVSSGTAALHLGLLTLGVGPGDRVLVPSLTFAASAFAVTYTGAEPVFIDVDRTTWCLDIDLLRQTLAEAEARGERFSAVMSVDLFGRTPNYPSLVDVLSDYAVPLVEDAAEAIGSESYGRPAGSWGPVRAVSFNGNKIVTAAGGGALLADSAEVAVRARRLATQARRDVHWFEHEETGFNYRLSNLQAAIGLAQLKRLDELIASRQENYLHYETLLAGDEGIQVVADPAGCRSNHWLTNVLLPSGMEARRVVEDLHEVGIEVRMNWKPMHQQPVFAGCVSKLTGAADDLFTRGVCLPSGPGLSQSDLAEVCDALLKSVRRHRDRHLKSPA